MNEDEDLALSNDLFIDGLIRIMLNSLGPKFILFNAHVCQNYFLMSCDEYQQQESRGLYQVSTLDIVACLATIKVNEVLTIIFVSLSYQRFVL